MRCRLLSSFGSLLCSGMAAAVLAFVAPAFAETSAHIPSRPACVATGQPAPSLGIVLDRTRTRLLHGNSLTIVAIGSSSTAGAGASSPAASYPSRLQALLQERFPGLAVRVINRGVNGEEGADMLARFDRDVLNQKPDLVLWQMGTNAVFRGSRSDGMGRVIHHGIERLRASGADVVLIDPQYAPAVITRPNAQSMVDLIAAKARDERTGLVRRFELMRGWHEHEQLRFETFVSRDGLHMNDWGYDCFARQLAMAIADSAGGQALAGTSRIEAR